MGSRFAALAFALAVGAGSAAAPAVLAPREFALAGHGVLVLAVPEAWTAELESAPDRGPPTVRLRPRAGPRFEILVTALWPAGSATLPDEAMLRAEVAAAATAAAPQSVERRLPIEALAGTAVRGFYFSATDRAPAPGEYKYLTQGMALTGQVVLAFTVLTNDGQGEVASAALELVRTAVQRAGAST
jgi:hypothetical protein